MKNFFLEHPRSINETYWQHFRISFTCGLLMLISGFAALVHAFFPFVFQTKASTTVYHLADYFTTRKKKAMEANSTFSEEKA